VKVALKRGKQCIKVHIGCLVLVMAPFVMTALGACVVVSVCVCAADGVGNRVLGGDNSEGENSSRNWLV
jgi:hypothetical protein